MGEVPKRRPRFGFDPRFTEAVFHCPDHRVLGKRLRPFSAWHKLQLEFHNSPLIAGGDVRYDDLELAVAVCRSLYPVPAAVKVRKGWLLTLWMLRAERVNLAKGVKAFQDYQRDFFSPPKVWPMPAGKGSQPRARDCDDSIESVSAYVETYGGTLADAWNMSLGELMWMNVCAAKRANPNVMIWTPRDDREKAKFVREVREPKIAALAKEFAEKEGLSEQDARKKAEAYYWSKVRTNLMTQGFSPEVADMG